MVIPILRWVNQVSLVLIHTLPLIRKLKISFFMTYGIGFPRESFREYTNILNSYELLNRKLTVQLNASISHRCLNLLFFKNLVFFN